MPLCVVTGTSKPTNSLFVDIRNAGGRASISSPALSFSSTFLVQSGFPYLLGFLMPVLRTNLFQFRGQDSNRIDQHLDLRFNLFDGSQGDDLGFGKVSQTVGLLG